MGDARVRTRTGASIVAIVRGGQVHASPGPEFALAGGDVVVVVGSPESTAAVADILSRRITARAHCRTLHRARCGRPRPRRARALALRDRHLPHPAVPARRPRLRQRRHAAAGHQRGVHRGRRRDRRRPAAAHRSAWSTPPTNWSPACAASARGGLVDLVLNAAPGVDRRAGAGLGPGRRAVAMAGVTYVTSSGITAKVLSDLGWLGNRETPVVLSLLVFEDLTMALYLPILTAMLAGVSLLGGAIAVAIALADGQRGPAGRAALRPDHRVGFVGQPQPRGVAAQGARPGAAGGRDRPAAAGVGGGRARSWWASRCPGELAAQRARRC